MRFINTLNAACLLMSGLCVLNTVTHASEHLSTEPVNSTSQVVDYPSAFFDRYRPNTALDMVRQLPGFQLDDGTDNRGFATAVGNILINNRRLSAKRDLPSATLARIPAAQVERIQLVRGQAGGIDLQGQAVVANVFLRREASPSVRWNAYVEHNNTAPLKPAGSVSISNSWQGIEYIAGVDIERNTSGYYGIQKEFDSNGTLLSEGPESSTEKGYQLNGISLNTASMLGETATHMNAKFNSLKSHYLRPSSTIISSSGVIEEVLIDTERKIRQFELGMDAERRLAGSLTGKAILLMTDRRINSLSTRTNSDSISGQTLFRLADTDTGQKEKIFRLEFDWDGREDHLVQFNAEAAHNVLDRTLDQTDDRGSGPVPVDVPGANSRIEELRGDFLIQDTWTRELFELDFGLGMEVSSVEQSGDADQQRDFTFFKPQVALTYSPDQDMFTRFSLQREVSQLDLTDFVSATVFEDNDLALGNPDIQPEKTWIAAVSHEQRYGDISVVKVTAFHHWITDVLDLLPITDDFEAPGNLGDGRRWGLELEGSLPLTGLGLAGSKLDLILRWQDSTVVDPVTGEDRILSGEGGQNAYRTLTNRNRNNEYFISFNFRQDLEIARLAWGFTVAERAKRPLYRVNELDIYREDIAVDAFIETTRWLGLKIRFDAQNISDDASVRERTLFTGHRGLSPVDSVLVNGRHNGRRLVLSFSGAF